MLGGMRPHAAEQIRQIGDRPLVERPDRLGDGGALRGRGERAADATKLGPRRRPIERVGVKAVIVLPSRGKNRAVLDLDFDLGQQTLREARRECVASSSDRPDRQRDDQEKLSWTSS